MFRENELSLGLFEKIDRELKGLRDIAEKPVICCECGSSDFHFVVEQIQTENGIVRRFFGKCGDCVERDGGFSSKNKGQDVF